MLIFFVLVSVYHFAFAKRIIPGVVVGDTSVGGLTYKQAVVRLEQKERVTQKTLTLTYKDKLYDLRAEDIDLTYNWDAAVTRAFEVGRTGNLFIDTKDKIAGTFKKLYIPSFYYYDEKLLNKFFATLQGDINQPASDALFVYKDGVVLVQNESVGEKIPEKELRTLVINSFEKLSYGTKEIPVKMDTPSVYAKDLTSLKPQVESIIKSPIALTYDKSSWSVSTEQKLEFLTFELEERKLGFNKATFKAFLESITPYVNELPRGHVTANEEGRVTDFELTKDGVQIDVDATLESFKDALFELAPKSDVYVNKISGPVEAKNYGIFALLGEGKSTFVGSASGRVKNLSLAAQRTDGVLVPPGAVYSLNDAIGEISAQTGYDAAWIILGSRTVLGHGGGVCQTSTTLFRAALNAGLPIVERNPHAYRVTYYEQGSAPGIDATIFQPSLDFKFKNDTPNYVLVQTDLDVSNYALAFKIFGTPDGRKVELTEPVISGQTPPPTPTYQDDPTLAKGVTKQVDFPAWGASVSFARKVTRGDETLYEDVFKTNYQPWRAVYLVGTKE